MAKAKRTPKKSSRKPRVERTRNSGTMTESMFWNWIRQLLRRKSMYWRPISNVRNKARVPYKGPNKRRKWSYKCSNCNKLFDGKSVSVHHIDECGTLTCAADLPSFVEKLFCEEDGLVLLCNKCHDKKHKK